MGCLQLGLPGLVNELALNPGVLFPIVFGFTNINDNGRCNGGADTLPGLLTIPATLPPGSVVFQCAASSPLSAGGSGLAFSTPVLVNF